MLYTLKGRLAANDIEAEFTDSAIAQLAKAGFENIILQNTIFPNFQYYDYTLLSKDVQAANRSEKLAAVAASAAAKAKTSAFGAVPAPCI